MIVTIDFESMYSSDYSLSRISETDYILDPRWETIMCAVKPGDAPTQVHIGHDDVARALAAIDWDNAALLAHNIRFDGGIAAWRYGVQPKLYLDTLGMARSLTHAYAGGSSLAKVAKYLGLPAKGDSVVRAKGKYLRDFSKYELDEYSDYCAHDCELSYAIFQRFIKVFPKCELAVIDAGIRMFIAPQVRLDGAKLALHLSQVRADKAALMARVGHIDPAVFSSNNKFAQLLRELGVDVPTKTSPATGQDTWALAKNDRAFKELCEDPGQPLLVQALLAARVGAKSTIEETRTATLLNLSQRSWNGGQGWMPVPLRYYAAHTGRFGGDGGFNFLNLRRGSPIRDAIVAPDGYRIVHRDSSQIEARMVSFLAGCQSLLDAFAEGRDIYSEFASRVYGRPVTKANIKDRFVGKTCVGADTLVLTERGAVRIVDVTITDKLWDGIEWVSHDGLIAQGQRETLTLSGVSLTPDHRVWCGTQWREAQYLVHDASGRFLSSALSAANLPSPVISSANEAACRPSPSNAPAGVPNTSSTITTSGHSAAQDVTRAPNSLLRERDTGSMPTPCRTMATAPDYSIDLPPLSHAVTRRPAEYTTATVAAASMSAKSGATTVPPSCAISRPAPAGMIPAWKWIVKKTTAAMGRAISGSLQRLPTTLTSARSATSRPTSAPSSQTSPTLKNVYDLLNAGPRHRFTILTDEGPLIVSNCILGLGYGMGAARFQHTLFIGNGGVSVRLALDEAAAIVRLYRDTYPEIALLWRQMDLLLHRMILGDGGEIGPVRAKSEALWLPNGMAIQYKDLRQEDVVAAGDVKRELVYDGGPGRGRTRIYGPKAVENACQALSRIVITDVITRVAHSTGYYPFLSTYDSIDMVVPESEAPAMDALLEAEFAVRPAWAQGLPLASEGGFGVSLMDAERRANT